ncbi:MAG: bifunctional phosphoribosylaminoimidazolecarboxamide formyltransferase/inosine monophosphate cyclohydrolase [Arcanobacterium sp.]|nr:bifunctional phosphoribosylaminoimidazolecarboxamide formyltransferase/inosine monophosphate cyclohydrolase [Arcanobacterium sp.]MDY5589292.1 bifunctional phosphoribosylaminoimidazolecarboxamide formyltransferase/inosine monophosphate cyclohydrolase [Arcanobacterium sp.]
MRIPFKRALISVFYKDGIVDVARALAETGCEILSTGSTGEALRAAGIAVTEVSDITGFPESFDGRVKTLHPLIHGGILARRDLETHVRQLHELGIQPIDLVIVNLYPFAETVASGAGIDECIEKIDIGGPAMIRAAAKNHAAVGVVVDPAHYSSVIEAAARGGFTEGERARLAAYAYATTAAYDAAVAQWASSVLIGEPEPLYRGAMFELQKSLRYGENPHQAAALYADFPPSAPMPCAVDTAAGAAHEEQAATEEATGSVSATAAPTGLAHARQLHGKAMSFNNYQDIDAAIRAAYDHEAPAVAVVKHANPCGIALGSDIAAAHRAAHACDPQSAYGGVIAANRTVSLAMAQQVKPIFTEVIAAPGYDLAALELLKTKKNLRILVVQGAQRRVGAWELKQISGGALYQQRDELTAVGDSPAHWELVAGAPATAGTMRDLEFAWRAVRAVRSNAILLAKDGASVGVGMGQVNRVDSCRLAVERANTLGAPSGAGAAAPERARGSVAASDAFFPFADGFQVLADAGVTAVVQPGGSIRDEEVIAAAQAAGVTMYFTHARHFAH